LSWHDATIASTIDQSSGLITTWHDKSINGVSLTSQGDPVISASQQNNLNLIELDGNDYFERSNFSIPTDGNFSIHIACEITEVNNVHDAIFTMNAGIHDFQVENGLNVISDSFQGRINSTQGTSSSANNSTSGFMILSLVCDLSSSNLRIFINGSDLSETEINYSQAFDTNQTLMIFTNRARNAFPAGKIGELIITTEKDLEVTEKIHGYLAHKWGISSKLPTSHPFKNDIPRIGSPTTSSTTEEPIPTLDKNYIYTSTFGTDTATYSIDESGKISVSGGHNQTANLFYEDPIFSVGDVVSVKITDAPPTDTYLSISTTNRAPNTPGESGIRLRWNSSGTFTSRNYINGAVTNEDFDSNFSAFDQVTLYIKRESSTTFSASFDLGSGEVNLNDSGGDEKQILAITGLSSDPLFIGIETWHSGSREFIDFGTENLGKIIPSTSV
jgi:hypothetical protein